jgi:hypothetical protein
MIRTLAVTVLTLGLLAPGATAVAKKSKKPSTRVYRVAADGSYDYSYTWSNSFPGAADPPPGPATLKDHETLEWIAFGKVRLEKVPSARGIRGVRNAGLGTITGDVSGYRRDIDRFGFAKNYSKNEWRPCATSQIDSLPGSLPIRGTVSTGAGTTALNVRFENTAAWVNRAVGSSCLGAIPPSRFNRGFSGADFGQSLPATVARRCGTSGGWGTTIEQTCTYTLKHDDDGGSDGGQGHTSFVWTVSVTLTPV